MSVNRTNGYHAPEKWIDHAIVLQHADGSFEQTVKQAPARRFAVAMACKGAARGVKIVFCKTADQMTRDERGQWDMLTHEDRIADAREAAERRAYFHHYADLF